MRLLKHKVSFLWSRIPYIAVYFLASLVIIYGVNFVLFKYVLPTSWFIRNFSLTATSTVEHTDVPIRVCRDRRGNYRGDVFRTIRVIPEGKTTQEAVLAGRYNLKNISVDGERCENLVIRTDQFSHPPGRYTISTTFCFTTKYDREHCIEYKSNVYEIRPATVTDVQDRIDELQRQIDSLRNTGPVSGASTQPNRASSSQSGSGTTSSSPAPQPSTTNNTTNNTTNSPTTVLQEPEECTATLLGFIKIGCNN